MDTIESHVRFIYTMGISLPGKRSLYWNRTQISPAISTANDSHTRCDTLTKLMPPMLFCLDRDVRNIVIPSSADRWCRLLWRHLRNTVHCRPTSHGLSTKYIVTIALGIPRFNSLRPRQKGRHVPDETFKRIFLNENVRISIKISHKFVP